MAEPSPLLEIAGPPHSRGLMYGQQAAARIRLGIAHYREQLEGKRFRQKDLNLAVKKYLPKIDEFDSEHVQEMRGIAKGAGVDFADIVLLNARTEVLQIAERQMKPTGKFVDESPDGCTGVIVLQEASKGNKLIHAQNWDWKAQCANTTVVLKIRRENGPDILTFTEAGALARSGMNSAGISITANYLECERDYIELGVPLALIRRKALEQEYLALAVREIYCSKKSGSNNMMLAHEGGIGVSLECAPNETFFVHPENGMIVHANHWQSNVALAKLTDTGILSTPDSLYRDTRVRNLLSKNPGSITSKQVKEALFDKYQEPWSVCRPERPGFTGNLSATVAMVVMQPELGIMEVAMLPAQDRRFVRYTLDRTVNRKGGSKSRRGDE